MTILKTVLLLIMGLLLSTGQAQDRAYAREVLDSLCSPHFDGRGYYNRGEQRASEYLVSEYQKAGLKPVTDSFRQAYTLSVNAIDGHPILQLNGKKLTPGVDYLIDPSSPTKTGSTSAYYLKKKQLTDLDQLRKVLPKLAGKLVVIDQSLLEGATSEQKQMANQLLNSLKFERNLNCLGVIELITGKLTYSASQEVASRPHFVVLKSAISNKIKQVIYSVESTIDYKYTSHNVIGMIEGQIPDSFICLSAHYDHLGRMGENIYFPGANDNASGTAMLLALAKDMAAGPKPKYSTVFISFGSEEIGLVGSKYFTEHPLFELERIKFLFNLDIMGTGDDGIRVVNGQQFPNEFNRLVELNDEHQLLKQVKIRGESCNSDHCFFYQKGVPCFFSYTLGGIAHYHNIYDKAETLPFTKFESVGKLIKLFLEGF